MILTVLAGIAVAVVTAAVVIGICECISMAVDYFKRYHKAKHVDIVKKESAVFNEVMRDHPDLRDIFSPDGVKGAVFIHENGRLIYDTINKDFDDEFNGYSGCRIKRNDQENAIKI